MSFSIGHKDLDRLSKHIKMILEGKKRFKKKYFTFEFGFKRGFRLGQYYVLLKLTKNLNNNDIKKIKSLSDKADNSRKKIKNKKTSKLKYTKNQLAFLKRIGALK